MSTTSCHSRRFRQSAYATFAIFWSIWIGLAVWAQIQFGVILWLQSLPAALCLGLVLAWLENQTDRQILHCTTQRWRNPWFLNSIWVVSLIGAAAFMVWSFTLYSAIRSSAAYVVGAGMRISGFPVPGGRIVVELTPGLSTLSGATERYFNLDGNLELRFADSGALVTNHPVALSGGKADRRGILRTGASGFSMVPFTESFELHFPEIVDVGVSTCTAHFVGTIDTVELVEGTSQYRPGVSRRLDLSATIPLRLAPAWWRGFTRTFGLPFTAALELCLLAASCCTPAVVLLHASRLKGA